MDSDGRKGIKDFCARCDMRCCSRAVVLPEERQSIIKAARLGLFQRRRVFSRRGKYYIIKGDVCPFLKESTCSIHDVRPLNCRIFPLVLTHQGKDAEWDLSPDCPGYKKVSPDFAEEAKKLGQPLLEKHRKEGPLV